MSILHSCGRGLSSDADYPAVMSRVKWAFPSDARSFRIFYHGARDQEHDEQVSEQPKPISQPESSVEVSDSLLRPSNLDFARNYESEFVYPPLIPSTQIRLVELIRRSDNDKLQAVHRVVDVTHLDRTKYAALSYTWGVTKTPEDVHILRLNGRPFYIRKNLWQFLQAYSLEADKVTFNLWYIDAICIDQGNLVERADQVKLQTAIYSCATEVITWLGATDDANEEVHEGLDRLQESHDWTRAATGDHEAVDKALEYIAERPYWTRTWIVQEMLLARLATIRCGNHTFSWAKLESLRPRMLPPSRFAPSRTWNGMNMHSMLVLGRGIASYSTSFLRLIEHKMRHEGVVQMPAFIALSAFNQNGCANPRDKLYGFLGLMDEDSRSKIDPDYEASMLTVYESALRISFASIHSYMEIGDPYFRAAALTASRLHRGFGLHEHDIGATRSAVIDGTLKPNLHKSFERAGCPKDGTCSGQHAIKCPVHGPEVREWRDQRLGHFVKYLSTSERLEEWLLQAPEFPEPIARPAGEAFAKDATRGDERFAYDVADVMVVQEEELREIEFLGLRSNNPFSIADLQSAVTFTLVSVHIKSDPSGDRILARVQSPHGVYYGDPATDEEEETEVAVQGNLVSDVMPKQHTAVCDCCHRLIWAVRWRCLECVDFDLCHDCHLAYPRGKDMLPHLDSHHLEPVFHPASILDENVTLSDYLMLNFRRIAHRPTNEMLGTIGEDPDARCAIDEDISGGVIFPWCPRPTVDPPYWIGNLNVDMKPACEGVPHIRCLGLRLENNDPVDSPPDPIPAGYRFYHQPSLAGLQRIRELVERRLGADVLATPVGETSHIVSSLQPDNIEPSYDDDQAFPSGMHFFIPPAIPQQAMFKSRQGGVLFEVRELCISAPPPDDPREIVFKICRWGVDKGKLQRCLQITQSANDVAWSWLEDIPAYM